MSNGIQLDTTNSHDTKIVANANRILSQYGCDENVLEIILREWCDDSNLESITSFLRNRAEECGIHETGDYANGEFVVAKDLKATKLHFGTLDNNIEEIVDDGDAYCVECSDGIVDVSESTFANVSEINDDDSCDFNDEGDPIGDRNPYGGNISSYWFKGTMGELLIIINKSKALNKNKG